MISDFTGGEIQLTPDQIDLNIEKQGNLKKKLNSSFLCFLSFPMVNLTLHNIIFCVLRREIFPKFWIKTGFKLIR